MIVACIALVAAFAGNAVADSVDAVISALKPNSVTGKVVKNGSLTLADFSKKGVPKPSARRARPVLSGPQGAQGTQGPAGTPDGYTKTDADAAFLGKTPKAAEPTSSTGSIDRVHPGLRRTWLEHAPQPPRQRRVDLRYTDARDRSRSRGGRPPAQAYTTTGRNRPLHVADRTSRQTRRAGLRPGGERSEHQLPGWL